MCLYPVCCAPVFNMWLLKLTWRSQNPGETSCPSQPILINCTALWNRRVLFLTLGAWIHLIYLPINQISSLEGWYCSNLILWTITPSSLVLTLDVTEEDNIEKEFLMSGGEIGTLDILVQNPLSNHEADTACTCAVWTQKCPHNTPPWSVKSLEQ